MCAAGCGARGSGSDSWVRDSAGGVAGAVFRVSIGGGGGATAPITRVVLAEGSFIAGFAAAGGGAAAAGAGAALTGAGTALTGAGGGEAAGAGARAPTAATGRAGT